jgi:hypothetical protein
MVLQLLEQGRPGEGRHLDCLRAAPRHGGFGGCDLYRFHHRVAAQAGAQALKAVRDVSPVARTSEALLTRGTGSAGWAFSQPFAFCSSAGFLLRLAANLRGDRGSGPRRGVFGNFGL